MRLKRSRAPCSDAEGYADEDRQTDRGEHERQRLHALGPEPRDGEGRERGDAPRRAARSPPKRHESSVPATVVPIHVSQISRSLNHGDEVVREDPEAVEDREEEPAARLRGAGR